jgi:hypothetical protein
LKWKFWKRDIRLLKYSFVYLPAVPKEMSESNISYLNEYPVQKRYLKSPFFRRDIICDVFWIVPAAKPIIETTIPITKDTIHG